MLYARGPNRHPAGAMVPVWAATTLARAARAHEDELLDEAIEESFPASDPPSSNGSVTPPGHRPRPDPDDKEA